MRAVDDEQIAFDERGLVPCVVQDWRTGEVLTLAYTNSYINYTPLPNGSSVLTPLNAAIQQYNAYTKGCAAGGTYAGTALCAGTTATGAAPGQSCYTVGGNCVANPYYSAPTQGLLSTSGNYATFDILPSGIGSAVDGYGAPYTATLVINDDNGATAIGTFGEIRDAASARVKRPAR